MDTTAKAIAEAMKFFRDNDCDVTPYEPRCGIIYFDVWSNVSKRYVLQDANEYQFLQFYKSFNMTKINVNWEISQPTGNCSFDFEDLNISSQEEWESLSEQEQRKRIQNALNEIPDQTYMVVDTWSKS